MPAYACGARVRALIVAVLATWLLILAYVGTANAADEPGRIRFAMGAESDFDRFSYSPSNDRQSWMREHYWRMRTYSPYFDSRLDWYPNAWNYKDAYAIYTGEALARERPEWILRDQSGNKLYVQFGCSNGSCPQYAGDIGNPAFRAHWIADMRSRLAQGYRGLFVDDVNMELKVSDGNGRQVRPRDPRTGETMSDGTWQRYMADFMVEIRAAFPNKEIVHNALWFAGDGNENLRRQLSAADFIEIERGVNDGGLTGGTGQFGVESLMRFAERRHEHGTGVILESYASSAAERTYNLAAYFLISSGRDAIINSNGGTPESWWSGYDVDLGRALGARYRYQGAWRRDFEGGVALLNEPGSPSRTITFDEPLRDAGGDERRSVTLGAASGAVLRRPAAAQTPTETTVGSTPVEEPTAAPTALVTAIATATVSGKPQSPAQSQPQPAAATTKTPARVRQSRARSRTHLRSRFLGRITRKAHSSSATPRVRLFGRVRGATTGKVKLLIQRRVGRTWRDAGTVSVTVSGGRYSRVVQSPAAGNYRVRANFLGTRTAKPSKSRLHWFKVAAR